MNTPQESAWFAYTEGEYYRNVRGILLEVGLNQENAELLLENIWQAGFLAAAKAQTAQG